MKKTIALMLLLSLPACGEPVRKNSPPVVVVNNGAVDMGGGGSDASTGRDTSVSLPDAMTTPGGPEILELSTNVMRLTEGERVTVSALVSDPDGLDDIVGGRLLDGGTLATFGNFDGSGGSYTFDLSWDALDQVTSIDLMTTAERVLTAEFVDTSGNRATKSLRLTLHCEGEPACAGSCGSASCGGTCRSAADFLSDDANCGRCGNACQAGEACADGRCEGSTVDDNVAGPCVGSTDCPAPGQCLDEATSFVPNGVCVYICSADSECPGTTRCATYAAGLRVCTPTCTTSSQCRAEFMCVTAPEGFLACGPSPE